MFNFFRNKAQSWQYQPIAQLKSEDDPADRPDRRRSVKRYCSIKSLLLAGVVITTLLISIIAWKRQQRHVASSMCENPRKRKEWRSLTPPEQHDYIDAVLCLMQKESIFEPESHRYDDFPYAHTASGTLVHYAASFLPWHRYFIHIFEKALVEECGFRGTLTYWDWTLDTADFTTSPIWDSVTGFGGNGDPTGEEVLYDGRCVVDGPFANTTLYWQSKGNEHGFDLNHSPHCLSRGFLSGEKKEEYQNRVTTAAIDKVLAQPYYLEFLVDLEDQTHNAIPQFIKGDFYTQTAPNDPIFFLHHTQVDRLWWMWQQQDIEAHATQYEGYGENTRVYKNVTHSSASLDDWMIMGGLGDPVQVKNLLSTQSELLCYSY